MDEHQTSPSHPAQLRPAKFGGVRREDVSQALADLARRNLELSAALATAQANEASLLERVKAAEDTLETFHATLEQASHLLAMAEERGRDIRLEAERDAGRIRAEATEKMALAEREIAGLESKKRQAVAALLSLRTSLTEVLPATPAAPPAAAAPVYQPAPEPVSFPEPPAAPPAPPAPPAPAVAHVTAVPDPEPLPEPEAAPEPAPAPAAPAPEPEPQFELPAAAAASAAPVRSLEAMYLESLEANRRS